MVNFEFSQNTSYNASLKHYDYKKKLLTITGIFDTGCTNTSMGLYSLSKIVGAGPMDIKRYIDSRVSKGYPVMYSSVASGGSVRCVHVCIHNCNLGSLYFAEFHCFVNIDDKLVDTVGKSKNANGQPIDVQPYTLIGLDIIRNSDIEFSKSTITLCKFDSNGYINYWGYDPDVIHMYQNDTLQWDDEDLTLDI